MGERRVRARGVREKRNRGNGRLAGGAHMSARERRSAGSRKRMGRLGLVGSAAGLVRAEEKNREENRIGSVRLAGRLD